MRVGTDTEAAALWVSLMEHFGWQSTHNALYLTCIFSNDAFLQRLYFNVEFHGNRNVIDVCAIRSVASASWGCRSHYAQHLRVEK